MNQSEAEHLIFDLRRKASLFLRAGRTAEVNRIQGQISHLQQLYGAVKGAGRTKDNDRTA